MDNEQIYKRQLENLREENNYSKTDLAKILGLEIRTYTNYENGNRVLPYDILIKLSKIYGVTTDYILGLSKERKENKTEQKNVTFNQKGGKHKFDINL